MNIQVDISKRVGWISDRVELSDLAKGYIKFQMKEAVVQALSQIKNIESEIVVSDSYEVKHGALHGVRNLECAADEPIVSENTNDATLETRIDSGNNCPRCNNDSIISHPSLKYYQCEDCENEG